jgi:glycosyltransferase involved in cell wall biosynthesis
VVNEASSDVSSARASLRPVLIASKSTLMEQSTFLRHLLVGLVAEPISTSLICPPGYGAESVAPGPVTILPYPPVDLPLFDRVGMCRLVAQVAKVKPTILHCLSESHTPLVRRLARQLDLPYVQTLHSLRGRFRRVPVSRQRCMAIVVPAPTIGAYAAKAYPHLADRVRQINIGAFIEEDTVCFSDSARLPSIVLAQPLQRVSDFRSFFKAVRMLLADGYQFMVVLMGSGSAEHRLRRLLRQLGLSQAVTIVPVLDPWRSVLAAGDIFVQPQPLKAFSIFLLEAMSLGTAVAACAGGVDDLIVPGQTAVVFEPGNEQSIRQALARLLDEHDFARRLAKTAQERVRADHSVSGMVSATLKAYAEAQQRYGA